MSQVIPLSTVLRSPVQTAVRHGTRPAYETVSHDAAGYLGRTPTYKVVKKFLHKYLTLLTKQQTTLLRAHIQPHEKVLVLYTGKDSFGDANLELCGRALLCGQNHAIDLLTLTKLKPQFEEDDVFRHVFTDITQIDTQAYDVVLLTEFSHRSLRLKTKHFRSTPLACLFGYFDGPARNQTQFSFAAFNAIFRRGLSDEQLNRSAKPYLNCTQHTHASVSELLPNAPFIALSIGGVDPDRTYQHWSELLQLLDKASGELGLCNVVLIGSDNGVSDAQCLSQQPCADLKITPLVGKIRLLQTRTVIAHARLFVGCDGGLMHVAHSTHTPSVAIFRRNEPCQYWLTPACESHPIQSEGHASQVPAKTIMSAIKSALAVPSKFV